MTLLNSHSGWVFFSKGQNFVAKGDKNCLCQDYDSSDSNLVSMKWCFIHSFQLVEVGLRWVCMTKKEWTTKVSHSLSDRLSFSFNGFEGDYEVLVKKNGVLVQTEIFSVDECTDYTLEVTDSTSRYHHYYQYKYHVHVGLHTNFPFKIFGHIRICADKLSCSIKK